MLPLEPLDLLDLGALFGEFAFEAIDYFVCALFVAPDVEDQERFVFVFHRMVWVMAGWTRGVRVSVKLVHGGLDAVALEAINGLDGAFDGLGKDEALVGKKFPEDMLDHRAAFGGADANAEAGHVAHVIEDGLHSVMAARGAAGPNPQTAQGKGKVIEDGENPGRLDLMETGDRGDGLSTEIHEAPWLAEDDAAGGGDGGIPFRLESKLNAGAPCESVHDHEAGIVARLLVLAAGIAETGNEAKEGFMRGGHTWGRDEG